MAAGQRKDASMKLRHVTDSIATRLIVLALAVAVVGSAVRMVTVIHFTRTDLLGLVSRQLEDLARARATEVDDRVLERRRLLRQLASTLPADLLGRPLRLAEWLGERHVLAPLFSQGLFVLSRDGQLVAHYPGGARDRAEAFSGKDYVRSALNGDLAIGPVGIDPAGGEPVLTMAAPVLDGSGHVEAVLIGLVGLDDDDFLGTLLRGRIGETGSYLLISPQQKVFVGGTDPLKTLQPTPSPGVNSLHDRAMAGFRGSGITVNAKGIEEIAATASVDSAGWFLVARLPTGEALALLDHTRTHILRSTALEALMILALLWLGLFLLFRPLIRAADHAERMTRGEVPLQALPIKRNDEIGHLTQAFNRLLEKLSFNQTQIDRMARHDALTGLPNRRDLSQRIDTVVARAQRQGDRIALLFLDLDGFKPINDSLGHEVGDAALVEVAARLSATVRGVDIVARVGGDEFVVVMGDLHPAYPLARRAACQVAAKCVAAIGRPMTLAEHSCQVGVSIGIALGDGQSALNQLMSAADDAMYAAKQAGRGCFMVAGETGALPLD
jgi:diguanylate cyclase (GGDEF)-like protein